MRILLAAALALTALATMPTADAAGPGAGRCGELPTMDPCWNDDFVCVWFSLQVPQCIEQDPRDLVSITASELPPLVGQCNFVTNPCWNDALVCVGFSYQVPQCVDPIRLA